MSLRTSLPRALLLAALLSVAGCSCSDDSIAVRPGQACESDTPPAGCGEACSSAAPCPRGLYCGPDRTCTADCVAGSSELACGTGQRCSSFGRCVDDPTGGGDRDASNVCAEVSVGGRPVTPTVILIVDQSASMNQRFGGASRWNVLRDSLLDTPGGLIASLQRQVEFGLAMYSAVSDDMGRPVDPAMCPLIEYVPPDIANYDAIAAAYGPASPIDDTPTGDAIWWVLDRWRSIPDPDPDPTIFIVATDGEPDRCEELDPQNGQEEAVAAVVESYGEGIRSFIISVGDEISHSHLQDMANAGLGRGPGDPDADFWVVGDDAGLRDALRAIVGGVLSCDVDLDGRIDDASMACSAGTVRLNDDPVPCDDANGWTVVDENTIRLHGEACDRLQADGGATLTATFPCDVIAPF